MIGRFSLLHGLLSIALPSLAALFLTTACISINLNNPNRGAKRLSEVTLHTDRQGSGCLMLMTCGLVGSGPANTVLVIPLRGAIVEQDDLGRNITPGGIKRQLDMARRDPSIRAVILKINSPGGAVGATDVIFRQLQRYSTQQKVPIYAHVDTIGASGAYYAAMAARRINARPTAMVGSIGVILRSFGVTGLMQKVGVQYRSVKSGKNKDSLSPFTELDKADEAHYQHQITRSYDRFLKIILASRSDRIAEARLREVADGRVYDARSAKDSGLIDSIGYFDTFYEEVKKENGLGEARMIAYLPAEASNNNIYEVNAPPEPPASLEEFFDAATLLHRNGLYYIWDPGVY